jgi:hypothetical protein
MGALEGLLYPLKWYLPFCWAAKLLLSISWAAFRAFYSGIILKTIQNQLVVFLINFGKVFALVNLERAK